jgi:hypothetical protein
MHIFVIFVPFVVCHMSNFDICQEHERNQPPVPRRDYLRVIRVIRGSTSLPAAAPVAVSCFRGSALRDPDNISHSNDGGLRR